VLVLFAVTTENHASYRYFIVIDKKILFLYGPVAKPRGPAPGRGPVVVDHGFSL